MQITSPTFKARLPLSKFDIAYKQHLVEGLKDTFNLSCKVDDLQAIAGPDELKTLINSLKPESYKVGEGFRANFHIHSRASDGSMSTNEFLERCIDFAKYIFNKNPKDGLPPFSAALTDHNTIKGTKEVLVEIAQNPEKYKNFKFVTGSEFLIDGYKDPHPAFEAVGLGFNPFDKKLNAELCTKNNLDFIKTVKESNGVLSWAHPLIQSDKIGDEFFTFLKKVGVDGVEGNYQYDNFKWDDLETNVEKVRALAQKYGMFQTGGTDSHMHTLFVKPNQFEY